MPGDDDERQGTPAWSPALVAVGLIVGLAAGTLLAWALRADAEPVSLFHDTGSRSDPLPETAEAAQAFLAAWTTSRRAEYIVVSEWSRSTTAGASATETRVFAQRLPDRIRSGTTNRTGRIGNTVHTCDPLPIDDDQRGTGGLRPELQCRSYELPPDARDDVDPEAMVAAEVDLMRRHVEGTYPLYRVSQDENCFYLRLARLMLVPPYGYRTTYCFDEESGAVESFKVERAEGVDTEELLWVTTEVTDADLIRIIEGTFDPASP